MDILKAIVFSIGLITLAAVVIGAMAVSILYARGFREQDNDDDEDPTENYW